MTTSVINVIGPLELVVDDHVRREVTGSKQRVLLAMLALHRGRSVSAGQLVDGLWGEVAPRGAEVTLRSHVSHLRRLLAEAGMGGCLETTPDGYRLALPLGSIDTERFEHLVGSGQEALGLGEPSRAASDLDAALGLWRGRPWSDLDDVEGAAAEATRLEALRVSAEEARVSAALAAGRHLEVVGHLEALTRAHPFHERFSAQLMLALYRSGRQADALAVYARVRSRLSDELGLDPGPELQALNAKVLQHDSSLLAGAGSGAGAGAGPARASGDRATNDGPDVSPQPRDGVFAAFARVALVGREAQLAALRAAWQAVATGDRRLALVSGPAGIGKTHLVATVAAEVADSGRPVLVGRCDAAPTVPFQPVASALRGSGAVRRLLAKGTPAPAALLAVLDETTAAEVPSVAGPATAEREVADGVVTVLEHLAADGPVLLVIDEAEQLDASSGALLCHVVDILPAGVLVVVSYRDPPGGRHPPLATLLGEVAPRASAERVTLDALDQAALLDLVRRRAPDLLGTNELVGRLHEHTGGHPLYAVEVIRSLSAGGAVDAATWPVANGVRDVLRSRLADLPARVRELLPVAAVLGSEPDVALLAQVTHLPEEEVTEAMDVAVSAGLVVESGTSWTGRYAFPQAVVRDALRAEVTGLRLRTLHLQAAEALQARPRPQRGDAAAITAHLRAAGAAADPEVTARFGLRAATEAAAAFAWDDALEHADAAVDLLDRSGPSTAHARAAVAAGMLWLRSGRGHRRALELLETALPEYLAAGDHATAGAVHSRIGGALCLHHSVMDVPRALEHFDAAERLLPTPGTAYHLHRGRAQAAMMGLRTGLLEESAGRAAEIADRLGRPDLAVVPGWARGWAAAHAGRLREAFAHWELGWRTAHERADAYLAWSPVNAAAMLLNVHLLDPAAARVWCRRGLGQPRLTAFVQPHDAVVDQLALALAAMGALPEARAATERLPADAGARRMLLLLDGRWEEAAAAWAGAVEADESAGDLHDAAVNHRWLAEARVVLEDRTAAVASLERALTLGRGGPQVPTELAAAARLAQLVADDRPEDAVSLLARCDEIVAAGEDWHGLVAEVELARAAVAAAHGDAEVTDTASEKALEVLAAHRLPWRSASALADWARLTDRRGDAEKARELRSRARAAYADLDAGRRWTEGVGG